jgi:hypothetical protein
MIFRCTRRLLAGTKFPITADPAPPVTVLAEWYVSLVPLPFPGRSVVMYTNSTTLVTVVAPGRTLHTTLTDFRERLPALLQRLGFADEWIGMMLVGLDETVVTKTSNRRVLGTMNEFAFFIQLEAEFCRSFEQVDMDTLEMKLADIPLGMLDYRDAAQAIRELARVR